MQKVYMNILSFTRDKYSSVYLPIIIHCNICHLHTDQLTLQQSPCTAASHDIKEIPNRLSSIPRSLLCFHSVFYLIFT